MSDEPNDEPLRDLLDALREEYRADDDVDALPGTSLEECDEPTRRSVEWMRVAWRLEAIEEGARAPLPPVALVRAARQRRTPRRRAAALVALAAAAALVVAVALKSTSGDGPTDVVDTPIATGGPVDPPAPPPEDVGPSEDATEPVPVREYAPDRFRSREDGVELVHGSVRIVLLDTNG